ncbi:MAG TPA: 6-bladed beta-propeller [Actinomycetota bacterium]
MRTVRVRLLAALSLAALVVAGMLAPAGAAITTPTYVRTIGFSGHAGLYAWGMATGSDGSIVVSDYNNYVLRRFTEGGQLINTFSGRGTGPGQTSQPYGVAVNPNNGAIYMADLTPREIEKYDANGNYLKTINAAQYGGYYASRVAVNSQGRLYVISSHTPPTFQHRLIVFDQNDTYLFTKNYNSGASSLDGEIGVIRGIAIGANDEVYMVDSINRRVGVWDENGEWIRKFGVGGGGACRLGGDLRGIAIDVANDWAYVVDNGQGQIEKFRASTGQCLDTFTAPAPPDAAAWGPRELTVGHDGNVYVADYTGARVVVFDPDGTILRMFPNPPLPAPDGGLNQAEDVAVSNATGDVYVADTWNHRVQRFSNTGTFLQAWGFRGNGDPNAMSYPRGIAVDQSNGNVWLNNTRTGDIKVYTRTGGFVRSFGTEGLTGPNEYYYARGIWVAPNGRVYIPDSGNLRLKAVSQTGAVQWIRPCGAPAGSVYILMGCTGVTTDSQGNVWAAAPTEQRIYKFSASGTLLGKFGAGNLGQPMDVAFRNGLVYVADQGRNRIAVFNTSGVFQGAFGSRGTGNLQFNKPTGLAIDAAGRLYVADSINERIQVFQLA